jgi:hypothetical protein
MVLPSNRRVSLALRCATFLLGTGKEEALMRRLAVTPSLLFALSSAAMLGAESPGDQSQSKLSGERCLHTVVQRTPGRFLSSPPSQEVRVERISKSSSRGSVCIFEISIANASNPTPSGGLLYLWEAAGPGLVFLDSYWHKPDHDAALDIRVVHLSSFRRDQVLITQTVSKTRALVTRIRLFAFNAADQASNLISVGAQGTLDTVIDDATITISGVRGKVALRFDNDSREFSIVSPTPESIAFYKYLKQNAGF